MPVPGVRHGPVFSEAMEIPFNQPHQHGPELDYIRDAIQRAHLCGDGYYTKKCHELLAERTAPERFCWFIPEPPHWRWLPC